MGQEPSGLQRTFEVTSGTTTFRTRSGRGTFTVSTEPITIGDSPVPIR
jgi:hypothetical protein